MDLSSIGSNNLMSAPANAGATHAASLPAKQAPSAQAEAARAEEGTRPANLDDAVSQIQDFIQSIDRSLHFKLDDSSGQVVVQVYAGSGNDLIRQIPSEEALRLAEQLEEARSLLFRAQA
ncbi:flagellar protein FlaG [Stutzerimonas tarimensis]|uniref:Flagellar protein FlaG n=1 Tax=Stutzerimonas tarimensis TaxID=1507735 RepID=A0ABV7T9F0_9GAMM